MTLGIGIIGAVPGRAWASISHVPAVAAVPGLALRAVATTRPESAAAAGAAFGTRAYADARALIADPAVDIVAVTVRVPAHRDLVLAALEAGKHVYCEWPLGRDLAEAEALHDAAAASASRVAVGLQARLNPALRHAAGLVASGAIGRVLGARLTAETMAFGPQMGEADAYLDDPRNGATHLAIHGGHALDAAAAILGPLADVSALFTTQYPEVAVGDPPRIDRRSIPDDVRLLARLASGAGLSVEVVGGRGEDSTFRLDVLGSIGSLALTGGAPRGFQSGRLALALNGRPVEVAEGLRADLPDPAVNVAHLYAALRDDIRDGSRTAPGFDDAVRLTRLCADALTASQDGRRVPGGEWPRGLTPSGQIQAD
ncbi:Gfo/Idh/MocA family protein [Methylobacterium sp. Gmos1]